MTPLDTLRQLLAGGPTPPLVIVQPPGPFGDDQPYEVHSAGGVGYTVATGLCIEDARLIATAPTHLADLITALEREAKVRKLHREVSLLDMDEIEVVQVVCQECHDVDYPHPTDTYPCPTIRILDGNE